METIRKGDTKVASIINRKSCNLEARYRLSDFCVFLSENDVNLVKNTLSCEVFRFSNAEWEALEKIHNHPVDFGFIQTHSLEDLVKTRLLVEKDSDDAELYTHTLNILRMMEPKKRGYRSYTILPTTDCNARCTYCYEEGCTRKTMTKETAQRLVDFICETHRDGIISLKWFGGEPLLCYSMISFICKALTDRHVLFFSDIITNASLVTEELVREMKNVWSLKTAQVSLDGDRRDYEARKRYLNPEKYNYDVVMNAIHLLADNGIKVNLRINYDRENIVRLKSFQDKLEKEFGNYINLTFDFSMLYQEHGNTASFELLKEIDNIRKSTTHIGNKLNQNYSYKNGERLRLHFCMADNMDSSILISPDGSFHNCNHNMESFSWGNIFDGVTDQALFEKLRAPAVIDDECRHCPFLPECSPFCKRHCPSHPVWCYEQHTLFANEELHCIIGDLLNFEGKK